MNKNKVIVFFIFIAIYMSSRYLNLRVDEISGQNRFISQNYSDDWNNYFNNFDELVDLFEEDAKEKYTVIERTEKLKEFEKNQFFIHRRIQSYENINDNFNVYISSLDLSIMQILEDKTKISDYDIETIMKIDEINNNHKYYHLKIAETYIGNRWRFLPMQLPQVVKDYEKAIEDLLEARY